MVGAWDIFGHWRLSFHAGGTWGDPERSPVHALESLSQYLWDLSQNGLVEVPEIPW